VSQTSPQILKPSPDDPTRYRVRWTDHTGTKKQRSFRRKKDAVEYRDKLVEQMARGLSTTASKLTLKTLIDQWWDTHATSPDISEQTRRCQFVPALKLRIIPHLGKAQIGLIDRRAVDEFKQWMALQGCQPPTIRATLNTLSSVMQRAVEWDYIAVNPVRGVRRPVEVPREGVVYEPAEVYELAGAMVKERDVAMVLFAAFCGLRRGEVFALKWQHVDLKTQQVKVYRTKSKKWTTVPLFEPAWWALALWHERTPFPAAGDYVFSSTLGTSLARQQSGWLRRNWRPACAAVGRLSCIDCGEVIPLALVTAATPIAQRGPKLACPVCGPPDRDDTRKHHFAQPKFHDLRHTFGSLAVLATGDVAQVAEWLGHSDPSMLLKRYKHQLQRGRDRAIDQFNALLREW